VDVSSYLWVCVVFCKIVSLVQEELGYCFRNSLLTSHEAPVMMRRLNIEWLGKILQSTDNPVYLGITLDLTLMFKEHCFRTKMKVQARNNLLRKLTETTR